MSLWQFSQVVTGWNRAQGAEEEPAAMSDDEFESMALRHANILKTTVH